MPVRRSLQAKEILVSAPGSGKPNGDSASFYCGIPADKEIKELSKDADFAFCARVLHHLNDWIEIAESYFPKVDYVLDAGVRLLKYNLLNVTCTK